MLTVLEVPNPRGILMPGMYAQVRFSTGRAEAAVLIPGDALTTGRQGPRVAVVDADHRRVVRIRTEVRGVDDVRHTSALGRFDGVAMLLDPPAHLVAAD